MLGVTVFVNILVFAACNAPSYHNLKQSSDRLSKEVFPTDYTINLRFEEDFYVSQTFSGDVTIKLNVTTEVDSFQLHAKNLEFLSVAVDSTNASFSINGTDLVTITPESKLDAAKHTVTISYTGKLNDGEMVGIYHTSYTDTFGLERHVLATQFEEAHARKAFPCFDQPDMKAKFKFVVTYPKNYFALSNVKGGSPKTDSNNPNLVTVSFLNSPTMPTYLLAIMLSEMVCKKAGVTNANKTIQLCSKIRAFDKTGDLALFNAVELFDTMGQWTSYDYDATQNITLAAIPDFAAGAMENLGLLNFREEYLLWDSIESSSYYKQKVITVLAHEISHQWFGNLVTVDFWNCMFLNEGFARFFEYHLANEINETATWELTKQFVIDNLQNALEIDSLDNSLPLYYDVDDPNFSARVNDVSYNKGGSVLRMVYHFLHPENFNKGIADYVKNFKEGNALPDDLWNSFETYRSSLPDSEKPPKDMVTIMSSWTTQSGYPLITVESDGVNLTISQKPFSISGKSNDTIWYIPITYTTSADNVSMFDTTTMQWLSDENMTISGVLENSTWIVLNNQQTGFYRVNYKEKLLKAISETLISSIDSFDEIARSQLVDDQINLARAGIQTYSNLFKFLDFLKNETSYYTWSSVFAGFQHLYKRVANEKIRNALNDYLLSRMTQVKPLATIDSVAKSGHIDDLMRALTWRWSCFLGYTYCREESKSSFAQFKEGQTIGIEVSRRSVVYCNALRYSDSLTSDYQFLWDIYKKTTLATEKVAILGALGCIQDSTNRKQFLTLAWTDAQVRRQDAQTLFASAYKEDPQGVNDILDLIADNHKQIIDHFGGSSTLNSLINSVSDYINTQAQIDRLTFISTISDLDESVKATVVDALATCKENLKETQKLETDLSNYFGVDVGSNSKVFTANFALHIICAFMFFFITNILN